MLSFRSHKRKPFLIKEADLRNSDNDKIFINEYKYYYANLDTDSDSIFVASFTTGNGKVYAKFLRNNENFSFKNKTHLPNANNSDLISTYDYKGESLSIGYKQMKENKKCLNSISQVVPCKVVFAVYGSSLGYNENAIEFSVHYYGKNDKKHLFQNIPLKAEITSGNYHYFNFYIEKNVENIYLSLSNMNGDADLLLNYGNHLPTMTNSDWSSKTIRAEFIDFNKDDRFFKKKLLNTMEGNYTVGVYAFSNTTYTLFLSTHPQKIITIDDQTPMSCVTQKSKDVCYFKYNLNLGNEYYGKMDLNLLFSTEFHSGKIDSSYAKLYNQNTYGYDTMLPHKRNNDKLLTEDSHHSIFQLSCKFVF